MCTRTCVYMCVLLCVCIFALSICKCCIDWPKDIPSNVLGDGEGGDSFHLASKLLKEHLSINISRHGEGSGAGRWFDHTHTHRHTEAGIIKIATASSSQHTLAKLELVVVYTVGGKELIHLRELLVSGHISCALWEQPGEESIIISARAQGLVCIQCEYATICPMFCFVFN